MHRHLLLILLSAIVLLIGCVQPKEQDAVRITEEVYRHHGQAFLDQNIDELMQDYTQSSILITPDGQVHKGKKNIRKTFEGAFPDIFPATTKLNIIHEVIEENIVFTVYTAVDTATGITYMPFASDTFIMEDGKIRYQTVAAQMPAGSQQANNNSAKGAIEDAYLQLTDLIKNNKPAQIAQKFYTSDAKFYPPNGGVAEGRDAIAKAFGGMIEAGLIVEPEPQEVAVFGDVAYEYGIGTLTNKEGTLVARERYIVLWKKENGDWKMWRDIVKGKPME